MTATVLTSLLRDWLLALTASTALALAVKATLAAGLTLAARFCLRRQTAALQHRALAVGFLALLLLPMAAVVAPPRWIPVGTLPPARAGQLSRTPAAPKPARQNGQIDFSALATPARPAATRDEILFGIWGLGMLLFLLPVASGLGDVRRLRRAARPFPMAQARLFELAADDAIDWRTPVRMHDGVAGPLTCGLFDAVIVLPPAARDWPRDELDRVLLHESEHARRRDGAVNLTARLVCALYWFHPLVWIAWRRLALEAERACDDAVLRRGDAVAYADQLVALAGRISQWHRPPLTAMASRTDLGARIRSVLDLRQRRGRAGWTSALFGGAAALALLAALSPARLVAGLPAGLQGIAHYPTPAQPPGTPRLEFDVVSVKPASPDERGGMVMPMPGYQGYICDNAPLMTDMTVAYGVTARQIQGGPSWMNSEPWDIEAKSDQPHSMDELHLMLEHALEDRFQMKLHHETRQETVMALKVDSGGIKMKEHEPPNDTHSPPIAGSLSPDFKLELKGTNITMSYLAFFLTRGQPIPVLDETGLTGHYDIDVTAQLAPPEAPPGGGAAGGRGGPLDFTPLFDALREQLGVRVEKGGKGPVDYLIIDSVQKPTAN